VLLNFIPHGRFLRARYRGVLSILLFTMARSLLAILCYATRDRCDCGDP
jgi:hypothetical protein